MRIYFAEKVKTRSFAQKKCIKNAGFWPDHLGRVKGGYICFEGDKDFKIWRNKKSSSIT